MKKIFSKKKILLLVLVCMSLVVLSVTAATFKGILNLGSGDSQSSSDLSDSSDSSRASALSGTEAKEKEKESEQDVYSDVSPQKAVAAAADGNWGLSFQEKGKSPIGNATSDYLKKYNAYYIGDTAEKSAEKKSSGRDGSDSATEKSVSGGSIYLTFDVGYENGYTAGILDTLKAEGVPAAFFVVGNFVEENPELVKRMTDEGHTVGNHTMHHPDMSAISDEASFAKEMNELENAYEKATGEKMLKFYRPPQGKYSESNLQMAKDMGYTTVFWSLAYVDWLQDKQPSREDALNLLNERIHEGAIVLLHSTSKTNSQILSELIQGWKANGYTFRPLTQLGKDSADAVVF